MTLEDIVLKKKKKKKRAWVTLIIESPAKEGEKKQTKKQAHSNKSLFETFSLVLKKNVVKPCK